VASAILPQGEHLLVLLALSAVVLGWAAVVRSRSHTRRTIELAEAARGFELLVERIADPVIIIDAGGEITYVNPAAMATFGYGKEQVGRSVFTLLDPDEVEATIRRIDDAAAGRPLEGTTLRRIRRGDGRWMMCESVSTNLLAEPSVSGIVVVIRDVSDRIAAERAAADQHAFTQTILDTTTALVVTLTLDGQLVSLNRAAEALTGFSTAEVAGQHWTRFVPAEERSKVEQRLAGIGRGTTPAVQENHWTDRRGDRHLITWNNALLTDADGRATSIIATGVDVTEARRAEALARAAEQREHERLAWEATHDALTGLWNRAGLMDRLDQLLDDPAAQPVAILFADLDGFKAINDQHGHGIGDEVLRVVAGRLVDSVRGSDLVGRLGGDEFVVLCPNLALEHAEATAQRIDASVADPIVLGGLTLRSGASTGTVTTTGGDAGELLEQADAAMYAVKRGRHTTRDTTTAGGGAPLHPQETARVAALHASGLLEGGSDPFIDTIVRLAAEACGTSMAAFTLIDTDVQLIKASLGFEQGIETPRSAAFCAHTILDAGHAFVVDDAVEDARFVDNPYVPGVRFYAGAPVALGGEAPLGALCAIDDVPRSLTHAQLTRLERLRDSLVTYLELLAAPAVDTAARSGE
jgi:diguanylate cyclase (GGDEF)-like protein/PAS domain S-box-containing protein